MKHAHLLTTLFVILICLSAPLRADSVEEINAKSINALVVLRDSVEGAGDLLQEAVGVLVFPDIVKLGFGVGGQYGEGALFIDGKPTDYYATAGASFGLQLGGVTKSEVILFMTDAALQQFRGSRGWEVGVDGTVTLFKAGAGTRVDSRTVQSPVVGFIFSSEGLMADLSLEGAKITRLAR
ncbi:hypothetical protein A3709_18375 [Halioglobus sp. HI00S01]|uniref:lipid-binding SYLF domain-containing protein n=1 Tax=Halioglobus sp. HI00S01 TaxID=1822214 RepID=UPI0007C2B07F|nr:YSC84-related protein [Halioglobus sp. HI00S01]KZX58584.1 hypothetical protein A3709_18375 [Halioglobus sp. HI00S01]